jgi:chromosome segregation ATPase
MTALAELDAAKSVKPDTSAADALKEQLSTAQTSHDSALAAKDSELEALKASLLSSQDQLTSMQEDLDLSKKELEAYRGEADAKAKTHQADYKDLNESMTALVEEAEKKVKGLEGQLEDATAKIGEFEKKIEEYQAQMKVKDAEIAEAKVCQPGPPQPLPCGMP